MRMRMMRGHNLFFPARARPPRPGHLVRYSLLLCYLLSESKERKYKRPGHARPVGGRKGALGAGAADYDSIVMSIHP
jgi:hypothetical protein